MSETKESVWLFNPLEVTFSGKKETFFDIFYSKISCSKKSIDTSIYRLTRNIFGSKSTQSFLSIIKLHIFQIFLIHSYTYAKVNIRNMQHSSLEG